MPVGAQLAGPFVDHPGALVKLARTGHGMPALVRDGRDETGPWEARGAAGQLDPARPEIAFLSLPGPGAGLIRPRSQAFLVGGIPDPFPARRAVLRREVAE